MKSPLARLPALGFGTAQIGGLYGVDPEHEATAAVRHALANQMTLFDTAPRYGLGLAEQRLGAALAGVPRERYVVSTKVGWLLENERAHMAFTRDGTLRSLAASRARLGVEQLDIVHIHDPDEHCEAALRQVLPALMELREQGEIGAISAGVNHTTVLETLMQQATFDCFLLAGRYTLLEQGALAALDACHRRDIRVLLGGVYNSGILATGAIPGAKHNYRAAPQAVRARVQRLEAVCAQYRVPLPAAALQFARAHPGVASVVLGLRSATEVDAALCALHTPIPFELWAELRAEDLIDSAAPIPA